jgi:parallel beta-helix repeat protein
MKKISSLALCCMASLAFLAGGAWGAEFCVSDAAGLQAALTAAQSNDQDNTIKVVQGSYTRNFTYSSGKSITLQGGYTAGCASRVVNPANTVLDAGGTGRVLYLFVGGTNNISVEGFTIQNGLSGGVYAESSSASTGGTVILTNNIITGNTASDYGGGGVYAYSSGGAVIITNNTITGNTAGNYGAGGVYALGANFGTVTLTNNTITGNTAGNDSGGGTQIIGNIIYCYNNIIWGNTAPTGGDVYLNASGVAEGYNNDYANMAGSWTSSDGNISTDPLFVGGGDYHLSPNSPCIDRGLNSAPGIPATDFEGDPRVIGSAPDMGADENRSVQHCVTTASELETALTAAQSNGQDDLIKVVQGTYAGSFQYNSSEGKDITLQGGYLPGCASRVVNPANTVLDAGGTGWLLIVHDSSGGDIQVDGFTLQNGFDAGLYAHTNSSSGTAGNITITNNIVTGNSSTNYSGGVHAYSNSSSGTAGDVTIMNNIVTGNSSTYYSGGVWATSSSHVTLTNNIITGNSADSFGGVYAASGTGTVTLLNNTITGNSANSQVGGAYFFAGVSVNCYNNIIWGNTAPSAGDIYLDTSGVANGYNNDYTDMTGSWTSSANNITADPLFIGGGDFHLQAGSPCIDTGLNSAPGIPSTDFEGNARIIDGNGDGTAIVDMGAYEYDFYCVSDATALQAALTAAQSNGQDDIIKVVQGTYAGNFSYSSSQGKGITLLGGYLLGCASRIINPANTILDGGSVSKVFDLYDGNGGNIQVDGFTIQNGSSTNAGAGLSALSKKNPGPSGTITITNNIIRGNSATQNGSGLYAVSSSVGGTAGDVTLTNNIITGNSSNSAGGGVFAESSSSSTAGTVTLTNNTISGNNANSQAGGAYISSGSSGGAVNCYNNIIWGNSALSAKDISVNTSGVANGYNNDYANMVGSWTSSDGNIMTDPLFVGGGNYHLQQTSPCIETGLNSAPGIPAQDFEGDARIIDGNGDGTAIVDMGADEAAKHDTIPPIPDPMTWAAPPYAASATSISMVATIATDVGSPPVSYYFAFVDSLTGGSGGADSGWQSSDSYTNTGLQPNQQYGYQVKARDAASIPNETSSSSPIFYRYTLANAPVAAAFTDITETGIRANWTGNGNPSFTQYYCENTTMGTNSGWTTNTSWDSSGLACETAYSFRVKAINGDGAAETEWTDLGSQATQSCPPPILPPVINSISDDAIGEGTPYTGPTPSLSQGTLPVTWSLLTGPGGMDIDSGTGVVSWASPTASGSPHTITIQATNTAGSDTESWQLTVTPPPGVLSVTPSEGLSSLGSEGGPFDPSSTDYTLENTGGASINWQAAKTQGWVTLSTTGGSLAPAASTTVTVSINSTANSLAADTYNDTVTFTNTTNGGGDTSRGVMLTVESCPQPAAPANPLPGDTAIDISLTTDLDWDDSDGATSYDVYFGTTYPPEKVGTVSTSAYDPGLLDKNTLYYWRIVAKNDCGETTGDLWQFTTAQQPIHIILHRDGALWSSDTGWDVSAPPYYPGTDYARALELREDASYAILHRDGAIYDSATGWFTTSPPYYPGTAWAVDMKLEESGYVILHRDGAIWSTSGGWILTAPPYYPGTAYAKALEVREDASYAILHRDGAIYDSASGWVMTSPPYYPGTNYAVDMKLAESDYVILHRDGAIWSTSGGWIVTTPPYYPTTDYARALVLVEDGYKILHRDGAIYDSATGWVMTSPPHYPGTNYAMDLEVR